MHSRITINLNINRTSTSCSNHTCKEGVVKTSEAEEEEEDLVEEEIRLHAINKQVTMPDISWNLQRHVHTVRDKTIMCSNVPN